MNGTTQAAGTVPVTPAPGTYTAADVAAHKTASNCWSVVDNNVYNLTSWVSQHPGGAGVVTAMCGGDGTSAFHGYHGTKASPAAALAGFKIGTLTGAAAPVTEAPAAPTATYTAADVIKHASASRCWSVVDKKVYDLTSWINKHPGGAGVVTAMCGTDGSSAFHGYHGTKASPAAALAGLQIGKLSGATITAGTDTIAPTAPSSLIVSVISTSQASLSWTASTDAVGVTAYKVYRCQGATCSPSTEIASPTTASYSDSGLTTGASYRYRVRAIDAAGNLSGYSNIADVIISSTVIGVVPVVPVTTTAPAPVITKDLAMGDKNNDVVLLKLALRQAGFMSFVGTPTNVFGGVTKDALKRFQTAKGISAKGKLSAQTRTLINSILSTMSVSTNGGIISTGSPVFTIWLQNGITHPQVTLLQKVLMSDGVYPEGNISGYFGPLTELALKRFQAKYGIATAGTPDSTGYGGTGPRTRAKLNELAGVASTGATPTVSTPTTGGTLAVGSAIYTSDRLFVRAEGKATGALLGVQAKGSKGFITSGPIVADGHTWWKIAYTQGFTGWSSQTWLSTSPTATTVTTPTTVTPKPVVTTPTPAPKPAASLYTTATVATHASASNCWSIVDGNVYNLTAWVNKHPGGAGVVTGMCGIDGSSSFHGYHGTKASPAAALAGYKLGALGS